MCTLSRKYKRKKRGGELVVSAGIGIKVHWVVNISRQVCIGSEKQDLNKSYLMQKSCEDRRGW